MFFLLGVYVYIIDQIKLMMRDKISRYSPKLVIKKRV